MLKNISRQIGSIPSRAVRSSAEVRLVLPYCADLQSPSEWPAGAARELPGDPTRLDGG